MATCPGRESRHRQQSCPCGRGPGKAAPGGQQRDRNAIPGAICLQCGEIARCLFPSVRRCCPLACRDWSEDTRCSARCNGSSGGLRPHHHQRRRLSPSRWIAARSFGRHCFADGGVQILTDDRFNEYCEALLEGTTAGTYRLLRDTLRACATSSDRKTTMCCNHVRRLGPQAHMRQRPQ